MAAPLPVLYLLPGLLCDESIFQHQHDNLADVCEVRRPRFRGLDSLDAMARRVLDEAPPRFSLAGFSMGGRVALQIMRHAPDRVERLCLCDTGVKPNVPGGAAQRQVLVELAFRQGMEALAAAWLPGMLAPAHRQDTRLTAPLFRMIGRFTPQDHAGQIKALVERPDARPILPGIRCPTLVVCGEQDAWAPPGQHREIAAAIPGAELLVIPDSGHFVSIEQPEAFTRALRRFMTTTP
jgi:pimeloyl-ACP methyl ester carboxylesterase